MRWHRRVDGSASTVRIRADRFLGATAVVYELTLVTADARLLSATEYRTLPNR